MNVQQNTEQIDKQWSLFSRAFFKSNLYNSIACRIALIYIVIGSLWILLSDKLLYLMIAEKKSLAAISIIKGWLFVLTTGALIYVLIRSSLKKVRAAENASKKSYRDLRQNLNELLENRCKLEESEERYRLISEATNDGIWEWDIQKGISYLSDRWYEIIGYDRAEIEDLKQWYTLIHPDDLEEVCRAMADHTIRKSPYFSFEYRIKAKNGQYKWVQAKGKALFDETDQVYRMAGSHTDITNLKEIQQKLHYLAYHDSLTGLPNKLNLFERLAKHFTTGNDHKLALFFINLDNFRKVNDALGQFFGDQFLIKVRERLETLITGGGLLYRLNGDEFVVMVESFDQVERLEHMATKILAGFIEPFSFDDSIIYLSASIGISIFPEHGIGSEELLKCAQIAMHNAKNLGKKRYVIFDQTLNEIITERIRIEKHLHNALDNNEFALHYQPQVDLETGKIAGFEALLRWNNPYLGKISPERFIKIAEETQLIIPIGKWVLQNACTFLGELQQQGYKNLSVSVNLSILQLMQNDFGETVFQFLKSANLAPQFLELEITESLLMESFDLVGDTLEKLKEQGIKIALDDFGKGYSSLNYLKQLPISTLKIDKTFIDTIISGENDKSLIGPIILLGQMLGLRVIAEGVETKDQLKYLIKHKCNRIQGYLFSKPVTQSAMLRLLTENKEMDIDIEDL